MKEKNNQKDPVLSQLKPWHDTGNSVWLASTVSLYRNIEKFKFPEKLDAERQKQIVGIISKGLFASEFLKNVQLYSAEDLSPLQKEYLMEHFLSQRSFHQIHLGEAFLVDDSGKFLTTLNIRDHIYLQLLDCDGDLENAWNRLVAIETSLGKTVSYAYSHKYGFLASDFNLCGTGLNATVYLQVPGIVHFGIIDQVLEKLADDSLYITGIQGNPTEIIGDILVVQNKYTLGLTEENIIANLRSFTTKMLIEENSIRSKILHQDSAEIKDKVSRAFGILTYSYQIEAVEALNALSLLKLGIELGWFTGISNQEINRLFFNCRRAHLLQQYGEKLKQEEIPHKRAEFVHSSLKNVKQLI